MAEPRQEPPQRAACLLPRQRGEESAPILACGTDGGPKDWCELTFCTMCALRIRNNAKTRIYRLSQLPWDTALGDILVPSFSERGGENRRDDAALRRVEGDCLLADLLRHGLGELPQWSATSGSFAPAIDPMSTMVIDENGV